MNTTQNLWPDTGGWAQPEYYTTIQSGDIDEDGCAELLARSAIGIEIAHWDREATAWSMWPTGPGWSDAAGWAKPEYYSTIRCADTDGDTCANLLGRSALGLEVWRFTTTANGQEWISLSGGPAWSDDAGWAKPEYYSTIQYADLDGYGEAEIIGRGSDGVIVYRPDGLSTSRWQAVLQRAMNDPVYKRAVAANPIKELINAGIPVPEQQQIAVIKLVDFTLADRKAGSISKQAIERVGDPFYLSADASWYGLTVHMSSQAVSDASNVFEMIAPLNYAVALAIGQYKATLLVLFPNPELVLILEALIVYLWGLSSLMSLMDRGNGIDLVIPWTSFGPVPPLGTAGLVIPIPR